MLAKLNVSHKKHKILFPYEVDLAKVRGYKYVNHIQSDSRKNVANARKIARLLKKVKSLQKFMVPIQAGRSLLFSSLKPLAQYLTYVKINDARDLLAKKMMISCKRLEETYVFLSCRQSIVYHACRQIKKLGMDGFFTPELIKTLALKLKSLKSLESYHLFSKFNENLPALLQEAAPILDRDGMKRVSLYSFQGTNSQTPSLSHFDGSSLDEVIVTLFNTKSLSEILTNAPNFPELKKLDFVIPNFLEEIPESFSYNVFQNLSQFRALKEFTFTAENTDMDLKLFLSNLRFPSGLESLSMSINMKDYFRTYATNADKEVVASMEIFQRELANLSELKNLKLEFSTEVHFERGYISFFYPFVRKAYKLENLDLIIKSPWKFVNCHFDLATFLEFCPKLQALESLSITAKEIKAPEEVKAQLSKLKKLVLNIDASNNKPLEKNQFNELLAKMPNVEAFRSTVCESMGKKDLRNRIKKFKELENLNEVTLNLNLKKGEDELVLSLIETLVKKPKVKKITIQFFGYALTKPTLHEIEKLMRVDLYKKVMIGFQNAMITKNPYTRKFTLDLMY